MEEYLIVSLVLAILLAVAALVIFGALAETGPQTGKDLASQVGDSLFGIAGGFFRPVLHA